MAINGNFIGLEYDSAEIRAAELKNENGKITVEACGRIPLEAGVIEDGFIRNPEAFKLSMNELLKNGSFTTNKVIFGVNNENVVMRYASFPKTDSERLRSIVLLQAQEYIPIPINEMEIDFVPAGDEKTEDGRDVSNVLIIAARTTMLTQSIDILSDSGLEVNDIDSSLLALSRGILGSGETEKFAILNLTDDMINFLVVKGSEISMVRSIAVPDRIVASVKSLCRDEDVVGDNVLEVSEVLSNELMSSLTYYSMQHMDDPIKKVYLMTDTKNDLKLIEQMNLIENQVSAPNFSIYGGFGLDDSVVKDFAACLGLAAAALEV